ncbi:hypothetical protein MKX01_042397 [Papaver californicum]|nr:hypothetical protein MKX01_042397 [Papaver californicum]
MTSLGISSPPILHTFDSNVRSLFQIKAGLTALEIAAIKYKFPIIGVLFPVTSPIPIYPDWSISGLMKDVNSDANKMQRELAVKEKFHQAISKGRTALLGKRYPEAAYWYTEALAIVPTAAAVLSNLSLCYACLDDGINALDNAVKCLHERPEWPKAYYRIGVALSILKRYGDAADAFLQALTLDPGIEEFKDAYMEAIEDRLNSIKDQTPHILSCLMLLSLENSILKDQNGGGSLHVAAAGGSLEVCKYLIEKLKLDVDSKDGEGGTPLYHAAMEGHFDTVRYLLEKGANPDASNDMNATPIHFAAKSGTPSLDEFFSDTKIITLLLSRDVRVDVASRSGTALQFAASLGHQDAVKMLLDHGANPNGVNSQEMLRPLISAIFVKSLECAELLLQLPKTVVSRSFFSCYYLISSWEVHEKEKFDQAKSKGRDAFQGEQYLIVSTLV